MMTEAILIVLTITETLAKTAAIPVIPMTTMVMVALNLPQNQIQVNMLQVLSYRQQHVEAVHVPVHQHQS
jgi:hypothetical protein